MIGLDKIFQLHSGIGKGGFETRQRQSGTSLAIGTGVACWDVLLGNSAESLDLLQGATAGTLAQDLGKEAPKNQPRRKHALPPLGARGMGRGLKRFGMNGRTEKLNGLFQTFAAETVTEGLEEGGCG